MPTNFLVDIPVPCLIITISNYSHCLGWSSGDMVVDKLSVPVHPPDMDNSRARAYCACSKCGGGIRSFFFLVCHFSLLSPSLREMARYRLKYCLKWPLSPNQPTNQLFLLPRKAPENSETFFSQVRPELLKKRKIHANTIRTIKCMVSPLKTQNIYGK